jgi:hypothetical protein
MRTLLLVSLLFFVTTVDVHAQSTCSDSCEPKNQSATLGLPSTSRASILGAPACSLRLVLSSPSRGEQMSIPGGIVERNFLGVTYTAPFNKISDHLVLSMALQNDATFPAHSGRSSRESITSIKAMEDDPTLGLLWSLIFRASPQSPSEDRVSLRATWRNKGSSSGFSVTEVRLAPSNFTIWCR